MLQFRTRNLLSLFLIVAILSLLAGCAKAKEEAAPPQAYEPVKRTNFLMGTVISLTVFDKVEEAVLDEAMNCIQDIEDRMTINKEDADSEIIQLNKAAGREEVKISPDTFYVLEKGLYYSELSQGKFDLTIGPVAKLWNFSGEKAQLPEPEALKKKVPLVNYKKLLLNKEKRTAKLLESGMMVDLGAIAKGYAADAVAEVLKKYQVKHAVINLGGNVLALGARPDGTPWRIGVQDPFLPRGEYMGIMKLRDQTLVSSGTYEKYLEEKGKRYHHIIDPQTGYPVENNLLSVSVVTEKSIDGDGLSTTIFLLGLEKGMELVEKLEDVEAVFITTDRKVYRSSGIKDNFEVVNRDYTIVQ